MIKKILFTVLIVAVLATIWYFWIKSKKEVVEESTINNQPGGFANYLHNGVTMTLPTVIEPAPIRGGTPIVLVSGTIAGRR
jgi:hypothetical protein